MKKINNYHLSLLLMIVFILNTILFQSIKITQGQQFKQPTVGPGAGTGASIITSPLSASLDLGGNNITGDGAINIFQNQADDINDNDTGLTIEAHQPKIRFKDFNDPKKWCFIFRIFVIFKFLIIAAT